MSERDDSSDSLEQLLRGVKPRRHPPAQAQAVAFHAVHTAWRRRRFNRRVQFGSAAAAVFVAAVVTYSQLTPSTAFCLNVAAGGHVHVYDGTGDVLNNDVCLQGETTVLAESTSRLTLPNGTDALLREGTRVRWNGPDHVFLEVGGLHVQTQGGTGLVVATPFGEVRDIGTVFSADVDESRVVVSLHEGIVDIDTPRGRHRATSSAGHGERVTINNARVVAEPLAGIDATLDWIFTGHAGYPERRADLVLDRIAKDMRMALKYASPELRDQAGHIELEGSLEGLGPREALQIVAGVCGFVVEEQNGVLAIAKRLAN